MIVLSKVISVLREARRAKSYYRQAKRKGLPGSHFFTFGRNLGWRDLLFGPYANPLLLRNPVSITRYYEFSFTERMLKQAGTTVRQCLDLSSPRLFSLYMASGKQPPDICMLNPDQSDLKETERMATAFKRDTLTCICGTEQDLPQDAPKQFDAIWSISVIEHIKSEQEDERDTLKRLWDLLKPGGLLILTIPTDKPAWDEYRKRDPYGTQAAEGNERYFFSRYYDLDMIKRRITDTLGVPPSHQEWFGENKKGHFHAYIEQWKTEGPDIIVQDPLLIAENYQMYDSYEEMPGTGTCGLLFVKPAETTEDVQPDT